MSVSGWTLQEVLISYMLPGMRTEREIGESKTNISKPKRTIDLTSKVAFLFPLINTLQSFFKKYFGRWRNDI